MRPSGSPFLKIRAIAMECSGWTERGHVSGVLLLRATNSLQYREGHEVFSVVTGGRPLSFSRLISGGNRSSPDFSGENAEPRRAGRR
jgi:hypothetical protein